ncbi:transposase [Gloeocapsopsis crepidinum]|uniref:transposase n=1 Tax=Gloeocapsopsis crepidinum TaxID=693223 RepID=UPI001D138E64|nr:transposase [Gloeocapsopsis crepidinum]
MASSISSRMVAIGKTCPAYLPPYSTVYWHYKQWRSEGVIEKLMNVLHGQVREQVKKKLSGQL